MNHFILATPEQMLCMTMGICGIVLVFWLKLQDEKQGGLEKNPNWASFMVPSFIFLAVQLQLIVQIIANR